MGDETEAILASLLRVGGVLETLCPYFDIRDWRSLSSVDKKAKECVELFLASWPALLSMIKSVPPPGSKIIVFGCHHAHPGNPFSSKGLLSVCTTRLNPCPILQLSLDRIGFDVLDKKMVGNPWSRLRTVNSPPQGLGRMQPGICLVNLNGSKQIFYCGGRDIAQISDETLGDEDIRERVSRVTASFCFRSLEWRRLPDMPEGRHNARLLQVGNRVLVFGGELAAPGLYLCRSAYRILCFDLLEQRWIKQNEHGLPSLPGSAFSGIALGRAGDTILVAGGMCKNHGQTQGCREAYELSLSTLRWKRLPDLPEIMRYNSSGSVQTKNNYFYVCNGDRFFRLEPGEDEWDVLPSSKIKSPLWDTTLVQNCSQQILLGEHGAEVYDESRARWVHLPQGKSAPIFPKITEDEQPAGIVVDEPAGAESYFTVLLTGQETAFAVDGLP